MKCCKYNYWSRIHNTSLSSSVTKGFSKLKCLSVTGLSSLVLCKAMKKMKGCKYGSWYNIHNTYFLHTLGIGPTL